MSEPDSSGPAVAPLRAGIWGIFDSGDADGAAIRRVLQAELRRRLPSAEISAWSPLGPGHPTARDGGDPPRALGPYSDDRIRELANELDCIVVAGAAQAAVGPDLAAAYGITAEELAALKPERFFQAEQRDRTSAWRLAEASLAPHPAVLLPRLLDAAAQRRRRETLRYLGVLSGSALNILVDAATLDGEWSGAVVEALRTAVVGGQAAIVLVDTRPPSASPDTGVVAAQLPQPATSLPAGCPLDDLAAVAAFSAIAISASPVLTALALGSGVPVLALPGAVWRAGVPGVMEMSSPADVYPALAAGLRPGGLRVDAAGVVAEADQELERLQRLLDPTGEHSATPAAPPQALKTAEQHAEQAALLRMAFETEIVELQVRIRELEAGEKLYRAEIDRLGGEVAHWRGLAEGILTSKTWRWTEPARTAMRRARSLGTRRG